MRRRTFLGLCSVTQGLLVMTIGACGPQLPSDLSDRNEPTESLQQEVSGLPPVITSVSPTKGPDSGKVAITIYGRNFRPGIAVSFAGAPATDVVVNSTTSLTLTLPAKPGAFGRAPIQLTQLDGRTTTRNDVFSYYSDSLTFDPASRIKTEASPRYVTTGDFNKDGRLDLAITESLIDNVVVYLGTANGFGAPAGYAVGKAPMAVTTVDLNADGKLDLVAANTTDDSISVLLGKGDGTFNASVATKVGDLPSNFASGDYNADGKLDLAVSNQQGNSVTVLIGKGDGSFVDMPTSYPSGGSGVYDVTRADLNGDTKLDLIATNSGGGTVGILLGKGDGTFDAAKAVTAGDTPRGVRSADFNGDMKADLAVVGFDGHVRVLLGNGDGTVAAPVQYNVSVANYARSIHIGNFNGDTKADLLLGGGSTFGSGPGIWLLPGNGDGTFGMVKPIDSPGSAYTVTPADVDGDTNLDLLATSVSSNEISVLVGDSSGNFLDSSKLPGGSKTSALATGDA